MDITVPADRFALGELLREYENVHVEVERIIPVGADVITYSGSRTPTERR